ncbi:MAG: hypothetical protein U9R57_08640 [Thermodesulfobacteriota bacterium]|nr:hypothetical protein [Thermodesulfobacteriota bacterium]
MARGAIKGKTIINLISLLSIFASALALAEADGPDYYRVHGVAANDVLNIRSQTDPHSEKSGGDPAGSRLQQ